MEFARALLDAWVRQLGALLLAPFLLGLILHFVERATQANLAKAIGTKGIVWWTGWLGTPVHELSHAAVGTLFAHKIHEIKLWEPHPEDGVLGYVRYSLPENKALRPYAIIGQFFSGVAPLFGGALVLLLVLKLLAPRPDLVLTEAERYASTLGASSIPDVISGFRDLVRSVYAGVFADGAASFRPWLFLYVALAVGAHLAPSPTDLKGGFAGFCLLVALVLVADAIALAAGADPARASGFLGQVSGAASALLVFALALNVGNLAFAFVVGMLAARRERRRG